MAVNILRQYLANTTPNPNRNPFAEGVQTGTQLKRNRLADMAMRTNRDVGGRLARNDLAGARTAAYQGGALEIGSKIDQRMAQASEEDRKRFMEAVPLAAGFVEKGIEGEDLAQALTRFNFTPQEASAFAQIPGEQLIAARDHLKGTGADGARIFGTVNPRDYTGESIEKFRRTRRFSDLERYERPRAVSWKDTGLAVVGLDENGNIVQSIPKHGPLSKDQILKRGPEGPEAEPVPGSTLDVERKQEATERKRKRLTRDRMQQHAGRTVLRSVTRSLNDFLPKINQGEGIFGALDRTAQAQVRGTDEWKLKRQVDDFSRNIGLDRLQQMRESSPTGGALGQVPVKQQQMLQEVLGSFDIGQDPDIMEENLKQLNNIYLDIMFGTPEERQLLMEEGNLSPHENQIIDSHYYETKFDVFGRREEESPAQEGGRSGNVPRETSAPQAGPIPPDAAIQFLMENPGTAEQFDAKYGEGASERILRGR